jgi:hypothetical protein
MDPRLRFAREAGVRRHALLTMTPTLPRLVQSSTDDASATDRPA